MGRGTQASQKTDPRDIQKLSGDHPWPRAGKPGRRSRKKTVPELGPVLAKTVRHFPPGLSRLPRRFPDPRHQGQLYYPKETLVWSAILMFVLAVKSSYFLLHVAHAINHLMIKGSLLPGFYKLLGSLRNFLRQLARSFAGSMIAAVDWDTNGAKAIQIRFDSS